jgi:UDP-N-acetylglucosamine transferase subunit ALG13
VGLTRPEAVARYQSAFPAGTFVGLSATERLVCLVVHLLVGTFAPAMAEDLVPFAQQWRPSLVVSNPTAYSGKLAAAAIGVPQVMHGFSAPRRDDAASGSAVHAAVQELFSRCGAGDAVSSSYTNEPYLDIWPRALHPHGERWLYPDMWPLRPENVVPLPAPVPKPAVLDLEGLPYDRTAYLTIGTDFNKTAAALQAMVEALVEERANLVVTTGANGDLDRFGPQPAHVRVERYVPQQALLPHCDVVVCHGGAGSVLGALAHKVPLVMLPLAADHHEVAAQVAAAGAGLVCSQPVAVATGGGDFGPQARAELVDAFRLVTSQGFLQAGRRARRGRDPLDARSSRSRRTIGEIRR